MSFIWTVATSTTAIAQIFFNQVIPVVYTVLKFMIQ